MNDQLVIKIDVQYAIKLSSVDDFKRTPTGIISMDLRAFADMLDGIGQDQVVPTVYDLTKGGFDLSRGCVRLVK